MQLMFKADPIDETCTVYSKGRPHFRLVLTREDLTRMDQARGLATDMARLTQKLEEKNARNSS